MNHAVYPGLCIHWDHHPGPEHTPHYGAGTSEDDIRSYLRRVRPDTVQYHTIGAWGYVSYPSTIAPTVPGLVGDPLATWSRVCREERVAFGCYAASFAAWYPEAVPRWRCMNRSGVVSEKDYCPNGPWTEEFFIPLLIEIMDRYHPSHFWLDGVWLPGREDACYCEHCQRRFQEQYGRPLPEQPADADWTSLQDFYEASLDAAVARVGRAIKQHDPRVLLSCNSLYYFRSLRPPIPEVDWLSWDVLNTPNLHKAAFEATYLNTAGKPADIMIYENGIVHWKPELVRRPRLLAQLEVETGLLMANGLRLNLWHDPTPDGSISPVQADVAAPLAKFVRERQDWCVDNDSMAQVALLASYRQHCLEPEAQDRAIRAAHRLLQEAHVPCDIVREDTLLQRLAQYRLIVLPEVSALDLATARQLRDYAAKGGCILIVAAPSGTAASDWLGEILGPGVAFEPLPTGDAIVDWGERAVKVGGERFALSGNWQDLLMYDGEATPWLAERPIGDGRLFAITHTAFSDYAETHWPLLRDLVAHALRIGLQGEPLVEMEGKPGIFLGINRRGGDLYIHLVNMTPGICSDAADQLFFDEVPVYRNLDVLVRSPRPPQQVVSLPQEMPLEVSEQDDALRIVVPELRYHVGICLCGALAPE